MGYSPPRSSAHAVLECFASPFSGNLPEPGIELWSSALQAGSLLPEPAGKTTPPVVLPLTLTWGVEESCVHTEQDRKLQTVKPLAPSQVTLRQVNLWENNGPNADLPESECLFFRTVCFTCSVISLQCVSFFSAEKGMSCV